MTKEMKSLEEDLINRHKKELEEWDAAAKDTQKESVTEQDTLNTQ